MFNDSESEKTFSLGSGQFSDESILPDFGSIEDGQPSHENMVLSIKDSRNMLLLEPDYGLDEFEKVCDVSCDNVTEGEIESNVIMVCKQGPMLKNRNLNIIPGDAKKKMRKKSLKCEVCKIKAKSLKDLNKHFVEHVRKLDNKLECISCGESVSTYDNFAEHVKQHEKKRFPCEMCGKTFKFNCLLKDHINLHLGYRPYLCSNCGKSFSLKASLKQHARTHVGVKKYKCIYCDFRVFVKADLTKHIRTHTGERPYVCDICGESYIQSSHLLVHKRSHSGERPYKCDLCCRGFTKKGDVVRHRRIHTGELPYLCSVCGKAFRQSTQCSNHVKHHHPGTVGGKLTVPGYTPNGHSYLLKSCDT